MGAKSCNLGWVRILSVHTDLPGTETVLDQKIFYMSSKSFFVGRAVVFLIIATLIIGFAVVGTFFPPHAEAPEVVPEGKPTFAWSYSESEENGIPHTEITLVAVYENGASQKKVIGRIEGGCNSYDDQDSDVYERSKMIICYYAGLGRYYKVVADGDAYLVQRKVFEEASPDYAPPVQEFETVATF
jgi:hypothetical protein